VRNRGRKCGNGAKKGCPEGVKKRLKAARAAKAQRQAFCFRMVVDFHFLQGVIQIPSYQAIFTSPCFLLFCRKKAAKKPPFKVSSVKKC
jgi:hypothetical protein